MIKHKGGPAGPLKDLRDGEKELLFGIQSDPGEKMNLAGPRPEKVKELRDLVARWGAEMDASNPPF